MMPEDKVGMWFVALGLLFFTAFYLFASKMESNTYNKLTGAHTTWFDALWVELRVQDQPR